MGIGEILFSFVAASFFALVIRIILVSKTLSEHQLHHWWGAKLALIKYKWKEIGWFLANTSFAGTLRSANDEYIGVLLLGYWSGKDAVAYYKVAKSFVKLMLRIEDPLYETIYPELVRFSAINALQDLKNLILFAIKKLMKILLPVLLIVLIFASQIIHLVLGSEYIEAVNALRVVTIGGLISLLIFWVNPVLLSFGRPGIRNLIDIVTMLSFILLLYLLAPTYSYMGAAFAFLVSMIIRGLVSIYVLKTSIEAKKSITV
jgi:O-antigen/teichoic acid export membrane protein